MRAPQCMLRAPQSVERVLIMNHRLLRYIALSAVAAVVWLAIGAEASACPSCKAALGADEAGRHLQDGFFWSILFMLSMPFLIFATLSTYFFWQVRKARAEQLTVLTAVRDACALASATNLATNLDRVPTEDAETEFTATEFAKQATAERKAEVAERKAEVAETV